MEPAPDGEALAVVLVWGLQDDAIAGSDLRLVLRRDRGSWFVAGSHERQHCRRGVTDDGLCV